MLFEFLQTVLVIGSNNLFLNKMLGELLTVVNGENKWER